MFVQDIEAYAARDQARPKRDAKVGMLPPKLAQIIINLANPPEGALILDPFCGTGVILQEALLMGYGATGSDIEERMVEFAKDNIQWLRQQQSDLPEATVSMADATNFKWPQEVNAVASELYLGPPLGQAGEISAISREISQLLGGFLKNLAPQLGSKIRVSLAIPAWYQSSKKTFAVPPIGNLTDMGYNHIKFQQAADEELIYWRPGQAVGRQLIVLEKV
jgi:tRNA (guanine10-N2)-dimethyltransferase